jgi:hypothetical protein
VVSRIGPTLEQVADEPTAHVEHGKPHFAARQTDTVADLEPRHVVCPGGGYERRGSRDAHDRHGDGS